MASPLIACCVLLTGWLCVHTTLALVQDTKVVRMKRNYEQPYDLQFHAPEEPNLVRVKRNRREAPEEPEPVLMRVKRDEPALQRVKRNRREAGDEQEPLLMRVKREEPALQRVKRNRREVAEAHEEPELKRIKRFRRDVNSARESDPGLSRVKRGEEELKRFKRNRRDVHSVNDAEEAGLTRVKRDEVELQRVKRNRRSAEEKPDPAEEGPELGRNKRTKRNADAQPVTQDKEVKAARSNKGHKGQKLLKREKKTNLNHSWQRREKKDKHHVEARLKKNALRAHRRGDLLANHALRNVHMINKRDRTDRRRVKRTQHKRILYPYNKLQADVAKLDRLRRDIALNLHKVNRNEPRRRVKRTHPKNKAHKKLAIKMH